jgi:hypothetical protein
MNCTDIMTAWAGSAAPPPSSPGHGGPSGRTGIGTAPQKRILILGESWYGASYTLSTYLTGWCAGSMRDYFFSRVFNAASGLHSSRASSADRFAFWNSVLFDNFVNWSVGATRAHRPTSAMYAHAAASFPSRLTAMRPDSVWVLGLGQAFYSSPVLCKLRYHHIVSPHPCGRAVTTSRLQSGWAAL